MRLQGKFEIDHSLEWKVKTSLFQTKKFPLVLKSSRIPQWFLCHKMFKSTSWTTNDDELFHCWAALIVVCISNNRPLCYLFCFVGVLMLRILGWGGGGGGGGGGHQGKTLFCRAVTSILSQRLLHKMTNSSVPTTANRARFIYTTKCRIQETHALLNRSSDRLDYRARWEHIKRWPVPHFPRR